MGQTSGRFGGRNEQRFDLAIPPASLTEGRRASDLLTPHLCSCSDGNLERAKDVFYALFRVTEEHLRVVPEEQRVLDSCVA